VSFEGTISFSRKKFMTLLTNSVPLSALNICVWVLNCSTPIYTLLSISTFSEYKLLTITDWLVNMLNANLHSNKPHHFMGEVSFNIITLICGSWVNQIMLTTDFVLYSTLNLLSYLFFLKHNQEPVGLNNNELCIVIKRSSFSI